jgi:hypothetical protein
MGCRRVNRTALLRAPLLGFVLGGFLGLGEEVDLLGDDLAAIAVSAILIGPFGVVDATGDHDHCTLGDMLGDAFSDAVEAGDAVPFGFGLAVAFGVFEAASCGERDAGDRGPGLGGTDFWSVANKADEGDGVFHGEYLSKLFQTVQGTIPLTEPR